jgi:hypothetical protein
MAKSDRQNSASPSVIVLWVLPLVSGFLLIMFFYIMSIAYPSPGYTAAGPLGMAIIFMGSGIFTKTIYDRLFLSQRIAELETRVEAQQQELTALKEKS